MAARLSWITYLKGLTTALLLLSACAPAMYVGPLSIDEKDCDGYTALLKAAVTRKFDVCMVLLSRGADPNAANRSGCTPLYIVAQSMFGDPKGERLKVAEALLSKGADMARGPDGFTPLHTACSSGDGPMVELLLARGAPVEARTVDGATPLYCAVSSAGGRGDPRILGALLERGASADAKTRLGGTPLHRAARAGYQQAVKMLLAKGADPNSKDGKGNTALLLASGADVVESLLTAGANEKVKGPGGVLPLHLAAYAGREEVAKLLLARGMDVNTPDDFGDTALHWSAQSGQVDILGLLLARGGDPNRKNVHGSTPLHGAASFGHLRIVGLLLSRGADAKLKNDNAVTPLDRASYFGHRLVVEALQRSGEPRVMDTSIPHRMEIDIESQLKELSIMPVALRDFVRACPTSQLSQSLQFKIEESMVNVGLATRFAGMDDFAMGDFTDFARENVPEHCKGSVTIRGTNTPGVVKFELESPRDRQPVDLNGARLPTGHGSVWRFRGKVEDLRGFSFEGSESDPLRFVLVAGRGLVYLFGSGRVTIRSGGVVDLPKRRAE